MIYIKALLKHLAANKPMDEHRYRSQTICCFLDEE